MRPSSLFLLQVGNWSPTRAPRRGSLRRLRQPRPENPRPAESGPRFPFPAPGRIGKRGFPVSRFRPSRESAVPSGPRFPAKSGIGGTGIGDFRVWASRVHVQVGSFGNFKLKVNLKPWSLTQPKRPEGRRLVGRIRIKSVGPIGQLPASARESVRASIREWQ
jgi:hypothetical protein